MKEILVRPSHIAVTDYTLGECRALENAFTYREQIWSPTPLGFVYEEEEKEFRIFGGTNPWRIHCLTGLPIKTDLVEDPYEKISVRSTSKPITELQKKMIRFLIGEEGYEYTKEAHQLSCNAETGEGKTFCACAAITFFRVKTIIILHRINIKENWIRSMLQFTDIDRCEILELNTDNMAKILKGKINVKKYCVYFVIHRSLENFAQEYGAAGLSKLFLLLGIGLKIFDEAHREFKSTTYIDTHTNTWKSIYLTATLKIGGHAANRIFQNLFRDMPKFNQRVLGYTENRKHIIMLGIFYNSMPSFKTRADLRTMHGFNVKKYSMYQVEEDETFFTILHELVDKFTIGENMRSLILTSRIAACKEIADEMKRIHPDLKVGIYNSSIDREEKARVLKESQLIISTSKSLGESETIAGLRFTCNCESFSNDAIGDQAAGRMGGLRKPDGTDEKCIYAELIDQGFPSITKQWRIRERHYRIVFGKVIILKY